MTDETPQPTGLADLVAEVKNVEAKLEAMEAAPTPAPAIPLAPIPAPIPPPIPPVVPTPTAMVISNDPIPVPADAVPVPAASKAPIQSSALDAAAAQEQARITQLENEKNAFYQAVLAARKQGVPPAIVTQPVPERIRAQTELEQAAGAAAVAAHAAAQGRRIIPASPTTEGTTTPVFRPADYVPDQRKGQGNVTSTTLT